MKTGAETEKPVNERGGYKPVYKLVRRNPKVNTN